MRYLYITELSTRQRFILQAPQSIYWYVNFADLLFNNHGCTDRFYWLPTRSLTMSLIVCYILSKIFKGSFKPQYLIQHKWPSNSRNIIFAYIFWFIFTILMTHFPVSLKCLNSHVHIGPLQYLIIRPCIFCWVYFMYM